MDNDVLKIGGDCAAEYMRMERQGHAFQGMAILDDLVFQLFDTGLCAVFDPVSRSPEPLCVFPLGSYNEGVPDRNYKNHSNQCMFAGPRRAGGLPLLWVTSGAGTGSDADGFFYRCSAEEITLTREGGRVTGGTARTLRTVSYLAGDPLPPGCEEPAWGCPAWFPDPENGFIYIFSARYRTTKDFFHLYDKNSYILTKFRLPDPADGGLTVLKAGDILDQTLFPYDAVFTQGGLLAGGRIIYTFGAGKDHYPDAVRVYGIKERRLLASIDLSASALAAEEIESCAFWHGELYVNTNSKPLGGLFRLGAVTNRIKEKEL